MYYFLAVFTRINNVLFSCGFHKNKYYDHIRTIVKGGVAGEPRFPALEECVRTEKKRSRDKIKDKINNVL